MSWHREKVKYKDEICEILTRIHALRFGTFTLAGERLSPYYINLRIVPSFPGAFQRIIKFYKQMAENDVGLNNFKRVAGIATAGIPFASGLAFSLHKPLIYTRKEVKYPGRERRVEGILHPGDRVLIVDDLITTGTTILSAAEAIRSEGGVVEDALVLIDREEGGGSALASYGIHLHRLTSITEVSRTLFTMEAITKEQLMDILKQIRK